jgi:hypothetical protein
MAASKSNHGYKNLGRNQISFEDSAPEQLSYSALPIATYLGIRFKNWHLKKTIPKKLSTLEPYREALLNNQIPLGIWSQELFATTTESSHKIIREFITQHAEEIVHNPHRLLAGGGGKISPVTFAGILMAGFTILNNKIPNKKHRSLADLQTYLDSLHKDIRSSHVIRFVNGINNKDWYPTEHKRLQALVPNEEDQILLKKILAVTAIRTSANSNAALALKAFTQMKQEKEFTGFQKIVIIGLEKIRAEGLYTSKSTKTVNYTQALHGNLQGVAVDRWLTLQFGANRQYEHRGKRQSYSPSIPLQRAIKAYIKTIAYYTNLKPAEIAAMMWFAERTKNGTKSDRGYSFTLAKKLLTLFPPVEFKR